METRSFEATCQLVGLAQKPKKVIGTNRKVPNLALEDPQVRSHNLRVMSPTSLYFYHHLTK